MRMGQVGYNGGKNIERRERHILVETLDLLLGVKVTPASSPERDGAQALLEHCLAWFGWLRLIWVDAGYAGEIFAKLIQGLRSTVEVQVVRRSDQVSGFKVLPHRWKVERTFGWFMRYRRLIRDYGTIESSAEAFVCLGMLRVELRRLARFLKNHGFSDRLLGVADGFDGKAR
jgi:putative transposase